MIDKQNSAMQEPLMQSQVEPGNRESSNWSVVSNVGHQVGAIYLDKAQLRGAGAVEYLLKEMEG